MLENFLKMTWYNPIFMIVLIGSLWFIPGIIIRRIAENRYKFEKKANQARKIAKLYPDQPKE
tara:strand:- start:501 stop:686 length:186 start_codon:yes stop_codon:yes gene_type:complete